MEGCVLVLASVHTAAIKVVAVLQVHLAIPALLQFLDPATPTTPTTTIINSLALAGLKTMKQQERAPAPPTVSIPIQEMLTVQDFIPCQEEVGAEHPPSKTITLIQT